MMQANGKAPVKMCDSVIDGSRIVLLMVKHEIPSGGGEQADLRADHG